MGGGDGGWVEEIVEGVVGGWRRWWVGGGDGGW